MDHLRRGRRPGLDREPEQRPRREQAVHPAQRGAVVHPAQREDYVRGHGPKARYTGDRLKVRYFTC